MNLESSTKSWVIGLVILCTITGGLLGILLTVLVGTQNGVAWSFLPQTEEQKNEKQIVRLLEEENATIHVVESVAPSVVSIVVKKTRGEALLSSAYAFSDMNGFFGKDPNELIEVSSGTGFFVTSDGHVLTNRHVVDFDKANFLVVTNEGKELDATLIDTDPLLDIAILDVEGEGFPVAVLGDSDAIRIGQTVIAIGNTLSEFRNTVTKGVVSGMNRRVTAGTSLNSSEVINKAIQTDAAINPGNSGGPLINLYGEVIGINTAISIDGESVAFSIPINQAKRAITDVVEVGRIIRPWLGVRYVLIDLAKEFPNDSFEYKAGAKIVRGPNQGDVAVFKNGPADQAGLKEQDILVAINDEPISEISGLSEQIFSMKPNDLLRITFLRDKKINQVNVTLAEYEDAK